VQQWIRRRHAFGTHYNWSRLFFFFFLLSRFFGFCSLLWYWYTRGMRISWLVHTVESMACLGEYNVVGVRLCMYSCNCTCIYIGKLSIVNKIMSHQWSNNWEPNISGGQHQYTILSVLAHLVVWSAGPNWLCLRYLHFLPTASRMVWLISLFMTFATPMSQVLLDMGCWPL